MSEARVKVTSDEVMVNLVGAFDENIRIVEKEFAVSIVNKDGELKVSGESEETFLASKVLENIAKLAQKGETITPQSVKYCITLVREGGDGDIVSLIGNSICVTARGKAIKPKTVGQKNYVDAMKESTIVMGVGPAGTGKTYLAVAMAVQAFIKKDVSRIILTRPAVEAGERLGFLPGDLQSKVDPYLRPLYDALFDMFGAETYQKHLEKGNIEVAPLAYMRGRTLDDSFIILDEAQNTTKEQMKMFLTRLGFNSKMVITGDITQIDLPPDKKSGLKEAIKVLNGVEGISTCFFTEKDVVRHEMVQRIIKAYEKYEKYEESNEKKNEGQNRSFKSTKKGYFKP